MRRYQYSSPKKHSGGKILITEIKSPRLFLRKMNFLDKAQLFEIWSDPEVTKYMNIDRFTSMKQVEEMIQLFETLSQNNEAIRYSIIEADSEEIIGTCGFNAIDYDNVKAEIGYDLRRKYWGKGYAAEAITSLIHYAFNDLNINRVEAKIEPENRNSIKLIERLGFIYEGTLREAEKSKGQFINLKLYSKLASDK